MSEPLVGTTFRALESLVHDLGHPKKILLSHEDFYTHWNQMDAKHRFMDQEDGPTFTVIATKFCLASWPKERPECIDLSVASEVSKRLHPPQNVPAQDPSSEQEEMMEKMKQWAAAQAMQQANQAGIHHALTGTIGNKGIGGLLGGRIGSGEISRSTYDQILSEHDAIVNEGKGPLGGGFSSLIKKIIG